MQFNGVNNIEHLCTLEARVNCVLLCMCASAFTKQQRSLEFCSALLCTGASAFIKHLRSLAVVVFGHAHMPVHALSIPVQSTVLLSTCA